MTQPQAPRFSFSTKAPSVDRVLGGGGVVCGSTYLLSGPFGVGLTTLALQAAMEIAQSGARVLFVSGEQDAATLRAMVLRFDPAYVQDRLQVLGLSEAGVNVQRLLTEKENADVVVLDSLQTCCVDDAIGDFGTRVQMNAVIRHAAAWATRTSNAMILLAHTPDGVLPVEDEAMHRIDCTATLRPCWVPGYRLFETGVKSRHGARSAALFELTATGFVSP